MKNVNFLTDFWMKFFDSTRCGSSRAPRPPCSGLRQVPTYDEIKNNFLRFQKKNCYDFRVNLMEKYAFWCNCLVIILFFQNRTSGWECASSPPRELPSRAPISPRARACFETVFDQIIFKKYFLKTIKTETILIIFQNFNTNQCVQKNKYIFLHFFELFLLLGGLLDAEFVLTHDETKILFSRQRNVGQKLWREKQKYDVWTRFNQGFTDI